MRDIFLVAALVATFAVLATVHVTIALGLVARRPRWHGLVALVVAPLAPYWAWRSNMRVRAAIWMLALACYVAARVGATV